MSLISFKKYNFKYPKVNEYTLKNIDLNIEKGEKVLILGKSGSGKSTLAKCINSLNRGDSSGSLEINSNAVGTILQDSDAQFVAQTVGEDIAFILENNCVSVEEMKIRVKNISKMVDMDKFLHHKPQDLSGGQKQRVALAGVLIENSDILLFDEPLANLDPKTGEEAVKLIDDIHKKTKATVIIIEHRLEDVLIIDIDKIVLIDNGEIVAVDSPRNIIESGILKKVGIREPLDYVAKKYAGIINTDSEKIVKEKLELWLDTVKDKKEKEKKEEILRFENVSFSYDKYKALDNINLSIYKGEMLSIVGKNGAGKSTLAKVLCGFETNIYGKILFKNEDMSNMSIKERADYIAYVMQNPNNMISQITVKEEVEFSLKVRKVDEKIIEDRVNKILKLCGIYEYRNWPISKISYGQKKRTTIASMLVLDPEILILDEPTAGQDYTHYLEIMEFLKKINEKLGITIIMITHDMHLMLEYTDRSVVLVDGNILSDMSSIETLTRKDILGKANLKLTSLYKLANKYDLSAEKFVKKFIDYEREVKDENIWI